MMKKLRACPFCGSENLVLWQGYSEGYVVCLDCMAEGPKVETDDAGIQAREKIAVRLWNARATDDVLKDVYCELYDYLSDDLVTSIMVSLCNNTLRRKKGKL